MLTPRKIDPEHLQMIRAIQDLPEFKKSPTWNEDQINFIRYQAHCWQWVGARIDYLERNQRWHNDPDPVTSIYNQRFAEMIVVYSDLYFNILEVLGSNFKVITRAASIENIDFPFKSARELFVEICRLDSLEGIRDVFTRGVANETLKSVRKYQSEKAKLLRNTLPANTKSELLSGFKKGGLNLFWIAAVIECVDYKNLKKQAAWKAFQKADKNYNSFFKQSDVVIFQWHKGDALVSATNSRANLSLLPHFSSYDRTPRPGLVEFLNKT